MPNLTALLLRPEGSMLSDLWHRLHRTMSRSRELLGVDEPLLALEDRLTLEPVLELELLWQPVNGLLRLDCVCSCMKEGRLMVKKGFDMASICTRGLRCSDCRTCRLIG